MGCYRFNFNKTGTRKTLTVSVPTQNGFVITNAFCPKELQMGVAFSFMTPITGESEQEFVNDCQNQVIAACRSFKSDIWDAHVDGLMAVINAHIQRCGRLIYNDMLIYVDCFAYLMNAHGYSDNEIKRKYPQIVKKIVESKTSYIKDQFTLEPFTNTLLYINVISKL